MQVVIEIPEDDFIKTKEDSKNHLLDRVWNAVANGTPLPKGHGDLIDRKDLIENGINKGFCDWYDEIKHAQPIIKADKPKNGCSACPRSGSIIDGYKDCPDAYTKQSQYCGFNNKE